MGTAHTDSGHLSEKEKLTRKAQEERIQKDEERTKKEEHKRRKNKKNEEHKRRSTDALGRLYSKDVLVLQKRSSAQSIRALDAFGRLYFFGCLGLILFLGAPSHLY